MTPLCFESFLLLLLFNFSITPSVAGADVRMCLGEPLLPGPSWNPAEAEKSRKYFSKAAETSPPSIITQGVKNPSGIYEQM